MATPAAALPASENRELAKLRHGHGRRRLQNLHPAVTPMHLRSSATGAPVLAPAVETTVHLVSPAGAGESWLLVQCEAAGQEGSVAFADGRITHTWFCAEGLNRDCPDSASEAPYVKLVLFDAAADTIAQSEDANAPLPSFVCRGPGQLYLQVMDYYGGSGTVELLLSMETAGAAPARIPALQLDGDGLAGAAIDFELSCSWGGYRHAIDCSTTLYEPGGEAGAPVGGSGGVPLQLKGATAGTAYSVTVTQLEAGSSSALALELELLPADAMTQAGGSRAEGWSRFSLAPADQRWSVTPPGHESVFQYSTRQGFPVAQYIGAEYFVPTANTPSSVVWPCAGSGDWLLVFAANCDIPAVLDLNDESQPQYGSSSIYTSDVGRRCASRWSLQIAPTATVSTTVELPSTDAASLATTAQQLGAALHISTPGGDEAEWTVEPLGPTTATISLHMRSEAAAASLEGDHDVAAQLAAMFPDNPPAANQLSVGREGYSARRRIVVANQPSCVLDEGSECQAELLAMFSVNRLPQVAFPVSLRPLGGKHRRAQSAATTVTVELEVGSRALTAGAVVALLDELEEEGAAVASGRRRAEGAEERAESVLVAQLRAENARLVAENLALKHELEGMAGREYAH
eukprot:SAG11_NODE_1159_length_5656_cov_5.909942_2_plen_631_part_00